MLDIEDTTITVVDNIEDVNEFFRWLSEDRDWLAWDSETGGLAFWKDALCLVQFGDVNSGWVFRADRWLGVVEEVFKKYTGRIVGQNTGFDHRFAKVQGNLDISWSNLHDTKIMAHLINPNRSTSLKALGAAFLSPKARKLQGSLQAAMAAQKWGWGDIPLDFPIYTGYAGLDAILTARIAEKFWPEIEANYKRVYELELEVARVCSNMEMKGTMIDLPYCEQMFADTTKYCNALETWCLYQYGVRPSETQKVVTKLVDLGVDLSKTTEKGQLALDKDVLEGIEHPLAKAVLEHRKKTKIASTYFKNFLEMHDNSVLHPSINTLGARTGRMTCRAPALQTLPRGSVVRDAFIPRPGSGWVSVDFDAIEMRLLAHFCQDPGMLEAIQAGDIHTEMARLMYQDDKIDKRHPMRQLMKNGNFAKVYGAGVEKLSVTAGVSVEETQQFLEVYDSRFPGVREFMKKVERIAKHRESAGDGAYVLSPIGRRHTAEKDKYYTLVNFLIQGTAADCFKQSLVDLDLAGFGEFLLLPVHDEAAMEIPMEQAKDVVPEIEKIMTQNQWSVPLTVSAEGPFDRWGDKFR